MFNFSALLADAPALFKLIEDGAAVSLDLKTNGLAALSNPATAAFLADVEKLIADLKAAPAGPATNATQTA
jgi:hypothetical protein